VTNWRRTINIKQYLDPDKPLPEVRDAIVAVLRNDRAYLSQRGGGDLDFMDLVDEMAETQSVPDFDLCLSALYDWADNQLVWIGPT
jgi:hypothetical protein